MDINVTTELMELHYDDLDFELGPAPHYYLKLKYPIHSVHPTQCLSIDPTSKRLEFNINTDYFDFETNANHTLKPKFDANGINEAGPLHIDFSTRKLTTKYSDMMEVNAAKELTTKFQCKGLKPESVLNIDATTKLLDLKYDNDCFTKKDIGYGNVFEIRLGVSLMKRDGNGVDVRLADSSLDVATAGLRISTTYKTELQNLKTQAENAKTAA